MDKKYFNNDILNEVTNITQEKNNSNNNSEDNYNEEYIIRNCLNKYNEKYENIIITNEISELLEQYDFYNNLILLLSCPNIQATSNFYSLSIKVKEVISLFCVNIGGINYLSKYHEKTTLLLDLMNKMTSNIKKNLDDFCFKKIKIHNYLSNYGDKNEIINNKFSDILIPSQKIENKNDMNNTYIQINFLQIYYLLDYINKYIKYLIFFLKLIIILINVNLENKDF